MSVYQTPRTRAANPGHTHYPYPSRGLAIGRVNQLWCADITYPPMHKGFLYLVAVMGWYSRKALSWKPFNTPDFFVRALDATFATVLQSKSTRTSMGGRGRWQDSVFIEGRWRSLKHECA